MVEERLEGPTGIRFSEQPATRDAALVAELLVGTYWNDRFSKEEIAEAHLGSSAWVVAYEGSGAVVGSARAISDRVKRAWIYDVIMLPTLRGQGIGRTLMRLLLDHPAMRNVKLVNLGTRDAQRFYEELGFREMSTFPVRPYKTTEMMLVR